MFDMFVEERINRPTHSTRMVIKTKRWTEVAQLFNFRSSCTNAPFALRVQYQRFLYAYERRYFLGIEEELSESAMEALYQKVSSNAVAPLLSILSSPATGADPTKTQQESSIGPPFKKTKLDRTSGK
jgi:hypothetical protein